MRFDIAVGNPPYARGMDIDFVVNAYYQIRDNGKICMITPGKWQAAEDDQIIQSDHSYGDFKRIIRPHIKHITYYLECSEIFEIRNIDGITYYLADKSKTYENNCEVENKVKSQKYFNNVSVRNILNGESLNNIGDQLNKILKDTRKFEFSTIDMSKRYHVFNGSMLTGGCGWGYKDRENPCGTYNKEGMLHVLGVINIRDSYSTEKDENERGAETLTFTSDSLEECQSFKSYLNTKLARFMVLMNVSKLNSIMTNHYFRFVPAVPNEVYDHIFTDEEVYKYFNIPQEFITIIEAVVKERD